MPRWFIGLGILCVSLLSVLFISSSASAVSVYDDLTAIEKLNIQSYNGNYTEDISLTYMSKLQEYCPTAYNSFNNTMTTGANPGWFIGQMDYTSSGHASKIATIYWIDNVGDANVVFSSPGAERVANIVDIPSGGFGSAQISFTYPGNGTIECYDLGLTSSPEPVWRRGGSYDMNPFILYNIPVNYPSGYEGVEIPDGVEEEEPAYNAGNGLVPKSSYTVTDLEIRIQDITEKPLMDSFKISDCYFQLPNNSYGDNFSEYKYDCELQPEVIHNFGDGYAGYNIIHRMYSEEDNLWYESTLVLDVDGSTFSGEIGTVTIDGFMNCMNDEFPFLHIEECLKNMQVVGSLLSFNRFTFGSGWNFSNECRDLEVLDDWMNLSNNRVCPMIDMGIRNTVTPFVTFAFGLMAITFISQKSGGGFD